MTLVFETIDALQDKLKQALKSRDILRVSVIRMLMASVKNKEIAFKRSLTEEDFFGVVSAQMKLRKEAADGYRAGNRPELVEKEESELHILQEFLPPQLTQEEILKLIDAAVEKVGAQSLKDIGAVMKELMPDIKGRADGKQVNQLVKERLPS